MKLRTILSLTALLLFHVLSFGQTGDTMSNPIVVGTFSGNISFSDTRNTSSFTNQYTGRPTNDVYHKLILTQAMEVTFTHEGSSVSDTYMHILDSSGTRIAYNDSYVINRYETTFNLGGTNVLSTINDPFLRYFPWYYLRRR